MLDTFIKKLTDEPEAIEFSDTISLIDSLHEFTPTSFKNGEVINEPGKNSGACKIFAFARLHKLSPQQTLACFGRYYRDDVLMHPSGDDHQNIRNFMKTGWAGVEFFGEPLVAR